MRLKVGASQSVDHPPVGLWPIVMPFPKEIYKTILPASESTLLQLTTEIPSSALRISSPYFEEMLPAGGYLNSKRHAIANNSAIVPIYNVTASTEQSVK